MGAIAGAFAMSHVVFEPEKCPDKAARVWAGMREIARRIQSLEPDLLIIATNDHLNNFTLALQAPFIVWPTNTRRSGIWAFRARPSAAAAILRMVSCALPRGPALTWRAPRRSRPITA
jgi:hypothetical protein